MKNIQKCSYCNDWYCIDCLENQELYSGYQEFPIDLVCCKDCYDELEKDYLETEIKIKDLTKKE